MSKASLEKGIKDDLGAMFLLLMAGAGVYFIAMFAKGGHGKSAGS